MNFITYIIAFFFKKVTVDSILTSFHKQIKQLDTLADKASVEIDVIEDQLVDLITKQNDALDTISKAKNLSKKLAQFVDPDA